MEQKLSNYIDSSFDPDSAKADIEKEILKWVNALKKGDISELGNLYTEDAKIMGHGRPSIEGRENIIKELEGFIRNKITGSVFKTLNVWGNNEILTEEGTGVFSHEDGSVVSRGKYLLIWKKENGNWKIFRDMYNSDGAPDQ
jgi:uncharacterized protein (TIGR02246 family)